jgi:hypothetical protein
MDTRMQTATRALLALLGAAAIVTQWSVFPHEQAARDGGSSAGNFFSYFTIQTNILITVYYLLTFISNVKGRKNEGRAPAYARMSIIVYAGIVAVVYWALLAVEYFPVDPAGLFANLALHLVLPASVFVFLLIDKPRSAASRVSLFYVLLYPAVYCVYTMVRGSITGWYPYFFMDPQKTGGVIPLIFSLLGLMVFFLLFASVFRLWWNRLAVKN